MNANLIITNAEPVNRTTIVQRRNNNASAPEMNNAINAYQQDPVNPRLYRRLLESLMKRRDEPITPERLEILLRIADDQMFYWMMHRRDEGVDHWEIDGQLPSGMFTPLTAVVSRDEAGAYEFVEYLLKRGADPNQITPTGFTPINLANPHMIGILIDAGADAFRPDPMNRMTIFQDLDNWLHPAARRGLLYALKEAERMNNTYPDSQTPWMLWYASQIPTIVKNGKWRLWSSGMIDLLSSGFDLDAQDPVTGNTALHTLLLFYPTGDGINIYLDHCISELIHRGARMDLENNTGKTASYMIRKKRNRHLQDIVDRAMPSAASNEMNVSSSSSSSSALGKRRLPHNGGRRRHKTRQRKHLSRVRAATRRR